MLTHGLRAKTVLAIAAQLVRERFRGTKWQRPTILDRLQFDLFRHVYRHQKPMLSTFFINSTAHFQHCYWRNLEPEAFDIPPEDEDQALHADAILYGYRSMDRIVGEVLDMVEGEAIVILATALSQQPCLTYEHTGGKTFYKADDYSKLLFALGIETERCTVEPVMSEQFHLRFDSEAEAEAAAKKLLAASIGGANAFTVERSGRSLMTGCAIFAELEPNVVLETSTGSYRFFDLFYGADTTKSGMHHPEGLFWVRMPGRAADSRANPVPLTDVAPTILDLLGLPAPASMLGRSLLERAERAAA